MKKMYRFKRFFICLFAFVFVFGFKWGLAKEKEDVNIMLSTELEKLDLSDLEQLNKSNGGKFSDKSVKDMVLNIAKGENVLNAENALEYLFDILLIGVKDGFISLSFILLTVIICSIVKSMAAEGMGGISSVCEYVGFMLIVSVLLTTFFTFASLTKDMLYFMQSFTRIIFPPLLTLLIAMGGMSSAGVFRPAMALLSGGMTEFISTVVLPIGLVGGVSGILGGVGEKLKPEKISEFCNSLCKWLMGIAFTVYTGIISVQGVMAATYDGVYIRTAKYTVDSFMPVVGGMMSDTVDAVLGCSLLLKNAIGFVGLLIVCSICLIPLIRFVVCILSYKLLGSVIETAFETKTVKAIKGLYGAVTTMFVICSVSALMTFITVGLAVGAGNMNIMLR